jgi:hypothetical protein
VPQDTRSGTPNIFPELVYDDAPAALEWLTRAFGFVKGEGIRGPDGTIAHAETQRNYCARDLEGYLWSFGTYRPRDGSPRAGI